MVGVGAGVVVMVGVGWAVRTVNRKAGQSQVTRQCPERATTSQSRTKVKRCGIEPWNLRLLQATAELSVKRRSERRRTASVLKHDPNTEKLPKNAAIYWEHWKFLPSTGQENYNTAQPKKR